MRNFEEYLQDQFANEHPTILDDEFPDSFDKLVEELDQETMFRLATQYGHKKYAEGKEFGQTVTMIEVKKSMDKVFNGGKK